MSETARALLVPVRSAADIESPYRATPIEDVLLAHNLGVQVNGGAEMLIVTCMDHRVKLELSGLRAFQVRTAGASPIPVFANIAFARTARHATHICVIGHTDCGMCDRDAARDAVVGMLPRTDGWTRDAARDLGDALAGEFGLNDPITGTVFYARWLRARLPSCLVAPLLFDVSDGSLIQLREVEDH